MPILGYEDGSLAPGSNRSAWRVAVVAGLVEGVMITFSDTLGFGLCLGMFVSVAMPVLTAAAATYAASTHRIRFGFLPHGVAAGTAFALAVGLNALGSRPFEYDSSFYLAIIPVSFVVLSIPGLLGSAIVIWNTPKAKHLATRAESQN